MKKIRVTVGTGIVGSDQSDEFEVEDDTTDDDIEAQAKELMFNMIEWTWADVTRGGTS